MAQTARSDPRGSAIVPALAAMAAAALATGGALATRGSGITTSVEGVSATASSWLAGATAILPLGYAFGAGVVSAVNPCGFAMLPAYVGYYLGSQESPAAAPGTVSRVARAIWISAVMTAGFLLLFGTAGVALGAASSLIVGFLPWLGFAVGVGLLVIGARLLQGGSVYVPLGERLADRLGSDVRRAGSRGYFAYGLAYGAASLSCTLPVFLGVIGGTLSAANAGAAALQVLLYGVGMGLVIAVVTVLAAVFGSSALGRARVVVRWVQPASAALLLLAGSYVMYYWLTLGGLLPA